MRTCRQGSSTSRTYAQNSKLLFATRGGNIRKDKDCSRQTSILRRKCMMGMMHFWYYLIEIFHKNVSPRENREINFLGDTEHPFLDLSNVCM